jgi:hypothetical protein
MKEGQAGARKTNIIANRDDTVSLLQPGLYFTTIWKVVQLCLEQALSKCEEYSWRNSGKQPRELNNEAYLRLWCFRQRYAPITLERHEVKFILKDLEFGFIWDEVVDG